MGSILWSYTCIYVPRNKIDKRKKDDVLNSLHSLGKSRWSKDEVEDARVYYNSALTTISPDEDPDDDEDEEVHDCPLKYIRQNQIRVALAKIAKGHKIIVPPKYDKTKKGICEYKIKASWCK